MEKKLKNNRFGFTIIEMLVSIFIIALISGIFLANYHSYGRTSELNMAAQKLASDLRKVMSYSMGLKEFSGSFPSGGWGIYFDTQPSSNSLYYTIFADSDEDSICDHDCDNSSDEDFLPLINLPAGITINGLILDENPTSVNKINLTFKPPEPNISICRENNNPSQCGNELEVVLRSSSNNQTKRVLVNKYGLIDVNN